MAEASQYRPIPELDLSGPAHVVAERWLRWKRSFDLYIAGQDIDNATRKHSLLLHYAGMNVQDLFETLTEPAQPEDRYAKTIAMLDGQFKVAKNMPFERHVFRQMCPEANEPIDKFVRPSSTAGQTVRVLRPRRSTPGPAARQNRPTRLAAKTPRKGGHDPR